MTNLEKRKAKYKQDFLVFYRKADYISDPIEIPPLLDSFERFLLLAKVLFNKDLSLNYKKLAVLPTFLRPSVKLADKKESLRIYILNKYIDLIS